MSTLFAAPVVQQLAGERLHLSHGPIDVVLKAWGPAGAVRAAYAAVCSRFTQILPELCDELAGCAHPCTSSLALKAPWR